VSTGGIYRALIDGIIFNQSDRGPGIGMIASPRLPIIGYKGGFSALRDGSNAVYQNTVLRLPQEQ